MKSSQKSNLESNQKSSQKNSDFILNKIKENPKISIEELALLSRLSVSGVKKIVKKLKDENKMYREGPDKGGIWKIVENNN